MRACVESCDRSDRHRSPHGSAPDQDAGAAPETITMRKRPPYPKKPVFGAREPCNRPIVQGSGCGKRVLRQPSPSYGETKTLSAATTAERASPDDVSLIFRAG